MGATGPAAGQPSYRDAPCSAPYSPLCTLALARYLRHPVTPLLAAEADRVVREREYQRDVLLVRPLGFVQRSAARRISYPNSLRFEWMHQEVCREHGFHLVEVPAADLAARADLVERLFADEPP